MAPEPPWPALNGCRTKLAGLIGAFGLPVDLLSPPDTAVEVAPPGVTWTSVDGGTDRVRRLAAIGAGHLPISRRLPPAAVVKTVAGLLDEGAKYEVVHLDTMATAHLADPLRRLMSQRGQNPRIVLSLNDSYTLLLSSGGLNDRLRRRLYCRFVAAVERRLLPTADYVDVVSEHDVAWLRDRVPSARTRLVPLGVDVDRFAGPRLAPQWDVLYLGAMSAETFYWTRMALDAALPVLRQRCPSLRVAVAGPDATPDAEEYFASKGVAYLGFVDDLSTLVRSSRVLLVSSRQRAGTPTKALQAMAAGIPVVGMEALRCIPNAQDGVHCSSGTGWADLAARMDRLLADDTYAARIGQNGRDLARAQHAWPVVVERYFAFSDSRK